MAEEPFWYTEPLPPFWDENLRTQIRVQKVLHDEQSPYQHIQVFQVGSLGRALLLDGIIQAAEADEFIYHEMVALLPCLLHPRPRRALIVGGGDGGALREALRLSTLTEAVMVELDKRVIEVCQEYLPSVSRGAFKDPKARILIGDGMEWVKRLRPSFDVAIIDLTDPTQDGPANPLYASPFFKDVARLLGKRGIISVQSGSLTFQPEWVRYLIGQLRPIFPYLRLHTAVVPSFQAGLFAFLIGSKSALPLPSRPTYQRRLSRLDGPPRYLSYEMVHASAAIPPHLAEVVGLAPNCQSA